MRPRLLDLFCGAGGAAMGYHRAGFDVVGVDIKPQPHYPFEFHQGDAMTWPLDGFDAIHASPPCQSFSQAVKKANRPKHPDLLDPTRQRLSVGGVPWVIENVPTAPLVDSITLCGSAFGLPIRRHRKFESNVFLMSNGCAHKDTAYPPKYPPAWNRTNPLRVLSISGGYQKRQLSEDFMEQHKAAMGHRLGDRVRRAQQRHPARLHRMDRTPATPGRHKGGSMTDYERVRAILDAPDLWPADVQRRYKRAIVAVDLAPELLAVAEAAGEYLAAEDAIGTVDARRLDPLAKALRRRDGAWADLRAILDALHAKMKETLP